MRKFNFISFTVKKNERLQYRKVIIVVKNYVKLFFKYVK